MTGQAVPAASYSGTEGDLWFDYVADLGDAFDPTMAIAWHLGRVRVTLPLDSPRKPVPPTDGLRRGRFLVLGGDEVYPYASRRRYRRQTVGPYRWAWEGVDGVHDPPADVFAIPGNHDWYGKLAPFREVFCSSATFGHWQTRQRASWFALELTEGWWLWAVDTGLRGDFNEEQQEYFAEACRGLAKGDAVILCTPVPLWVLYRRHNAQLRTIDCFVDKIRAAGATVPLFLAGDSHLFAALHRRDAGALHITSGGGGAFLHPTHNLLIDPKAPMYPEFSPADRWPSEDSSRTLGDKSWRVVADRQSRLLLPLVAAVHLAYAGLTNVRWLSWTSSTPGRSFAAAVGWVASAPLSWLLLLFIAGGCVLAFGANTRAALVSAAARRAGATLAVAEVGAFALASAAGRWAASHWATTRSASVVWMAVAASAGAVVSLLLLASAIARSNLRIDVADNLAFSGRHLSRYKHFVRCRIRADNGNLELFVVGLRDPGKGWDRVVTSPGTALPDGCRATYVYGTTVTKSTVA
jgi:hypothetical protein